MVWQVEAYFVFWAEQMRVLEHERHAKRPPVPSTRAALKGLDQMKSLFALTQRHQRRARR